MNIICTIFRSGMLLLAVCVSTGLAQSPRAPASDVTGVGNDADTEARIAARLLHAPHYDMNVTLTDHSVAVRQTVRWTNSANIPARELLFHVYPRHRPDERMRNIYKRTMEALRVDPRTALDEQGRRITIRDIRVGNTALAHYYDSEHDTQLHVLLPHPLAPGEAIEVVLDYVLEIPPVQGRFGNYRGVINLMNWYPVLAVFGDGGWDAPPYIGWHQPWLTEAANYSVRLTLPADRRVASGGHVTRTELLNETTQRLHIEGVGLRDFGVVASRRFTLYETASGGVAIRVLAFPEHEFHARIIVQTAVECLEQYQQWFGPYPYKELEIVESFFGWNGNESSGLVMIDSRIFDAPTSAQLYVDSLASHEICHQWWYSAVGTDGYREPVMDEGLVTYLTQWRMKIKYGDDAAVLAHPAGMEWLPNICYRTLVRQGYLKFWRQGDRGQSLASLDEIGHLHNTFDLVYDRGSKIMGMLHHRLGTPQFFGFLRTLYDKYRYRIIRMADFQRELELYTGRSWDAFFADWLRSPKVTDWSVGGVDVDRSFGAYRTTVRVVQHQEIQEPVQIGYRLQPHGPMADVVVLDPSVDQYQHGSTTVARCGPQEWMVTFHSFEPPQQVEIDPEGWILDADPENNRWRSEPAIRWTPLYTPLDEIPLTRPIDRPSFVAGPNIDQEGRFGLRGSWMSLHRYRISPFISFTPEDNNNHLTAGLEGIVHNAPAPKWDVGFRYERSLASNLFDDPGDQGRVFLRWNRSPATSFIYPHPSTVDFYFRFGDNDFPFEDVRPTLTPGIENYRDIRAVGVAFHADTRLPYWNPDNGWAIDAAFEHGFVLFGEGETFNRVWGQLAAVQRLDGTPGYLSRTKLAGRVTGGIGSPDNGEHFRFAGSTRFRGQRSEDNEGSAFWVASAEWRFPLIDDINYQAYDNFATLRSIYGSLFYDVGESYLLNRSLGIDHAVGAGVYLDIPLLSFVENLTVRVEYAHSIENGHDIVWLGWYHAF